MGTQEYKHKLSAYLGGNTDIFLYWKGRVALYALLKAMKVGPGDEVILPGFTCVVVPNAIKYLGAKPVYVDVQRGPMNASPDSYRKAITSKTKVIITQNTFGLSFGVDEIAGLAKNAGIRSIEDCTHGFGGTFKGKPNGSYCDAAFFSTQWNKPFSTGIGGFASVNDKSLIPDLHQVNGDLLKPSGKDKLVLSALLFARDFVLNPSNYWRLRSLYRILSKYNLVIGSSKGEELSGIQMPGDYFKDISDTQVKKGISNLGNLPVIIERRKKNAEIYTHFLKERGKYHVDLKYFEDHSFLKYPVLVQNRQNFDELAYKRKIELGDWFCTPLYPVKENWNLWDLNEKDVPNALFLSKHIENFPTDTANPKKVLKFAEAHINEFI
ncbi:MAG: DegT/DnrJ/EryC1/StrS family aminotransferase [Bacteroidales bacterium]|nr:DegT/DnrJ/EryC1/StrS family aminotransferase [Bacteroidales bacterium]